MPEPSIKGTVLDALVGDINRLREEGRITPEKVEACLEPEDHKLLEEKLLASSWYPITSYERLVHLLKETLGGDEDWLRGRGAAAAERLIAGGLYQQLTRLKTEAEAERPTDFDAFRHTIKVVASLNHAILSFGTCSVEDDPDHERRIMVEMTDVAAVPEVLRYTTEGFYNACTRASERDYRWQSSRPAPDRILMRMDRDFDA